ncbi:MAG: hypothetical protein NVV63_14340 [Opitutus sp.]|nr:hypothetical protein [Opitutus sp.]
MNADRLQATLLDFGLELLERQIARAGRLDFDEAVGILHEIERRGHVFLGGVAQAPHLDADVVLVIHFRLRGGKARRGRHERKKQSE